MKNLLTLKKYIFRNIIKHILQNVTHMSKKNGLSLISNPF